MIRIIHDIENRAHSRQTMLCVYLLAMVFGTFLPGAVLVPVASNNVHEQQYQMHRLATEFFPGPVAVNDIGWVSYRNEAPVLDLWGLASTDALRARRTRSAPTALAKLVNQSGAPLIMIYDEWFGTRMTAEWVPLARLHLSKRAIYVAEDTVALYAPIGADIAQNAGKATGILRRTLPTGASLELY